MGRLAHRALCVSLAGDEVCPSVAQRMAGFDSEGCPGRVPEQGQGGLCVDIGHRLNRADSLAVVSGELGNRMLSL